MTEAIGIALLNSQNIKTGKDKMKYTVKLMANEDERSFTIVADNPKKAALTAIHQILSENLEVVEAEVHNIEGHAWYYRIKVNHSTRRLEILNKKTIR